MGWHRSRYRGDSYRISAPTRKLGVAAIVTKASRSGRLIFSGGTVTCQIQAKPYTRGRSLQGILRRRLRGFAVYQGADHCYRGFLDAGAWHCVARLYPGQPRGGGDPPNRARGTSLSRERIGIRIRSSSRLASARRNRRRSSSRNFGARAAQVKIFRRRSRAAPAVDKDSPARRVSVACSGSSQSEQQSLSVEPKLDDPLRASTEEFAAEGFTHVECHCPAAA
jgi:hypothetical protein